MTIFDYIEIFRCPDCLSHLKINKNDLVCSGCKRVFKVYCDICVDLMPKTKKIFKEEPYVRTRFIETYNKLFNEELIWNEITNPWGLEVPQTYIHKLSKHKIMIYNLIPTSVGTGIDISAGSGRFSWDIAKKAKLFIFNDISCDSVVYLTNKVINEGIKNVLVVRSDYFLSPFKENIFNLCLCQDTLIYGLENDMSLLKTIFNILQKNGAAVVDFSNKYHRGFWHKPYAYGYSYREMSKMLESIGFSIKDYIPLYYELSKDLEEKTLLSKLLKLILPPTRYIFKIVK